MAFICRRYILEHLRYHQLPLHYIQTWRALVNEIHPYAQTNHLSLHPRELRKSLGPHPPIPVHLLTSPSHTSVTIHRRIDTKMPVPFWTIGTLFGASSVMLGAFGAHGLKQRIADPARIANWGTAAQYQV
jgi:hypothetical protein